MDAIYQCYKKNKQVEFVIKNFFKNGGETIYLTSDNGNDFSYLIDYYPNKIIYNFNPEKTWCNLYGWESKSQALHWMIWFTEGCRILKSKYIILLEDDVFIRGNINTIPIQKEIIGPFGHVGNQLPPVVNEYISQIDGKSIPLNTYGGCGGSIMNREIISEGEFPYILNKYYNDFCHLTHKLKFSDAFLTTAFRVLGYEYGVNLDHTEPWFNPNWQTTNEKIVHQYECDDGN